MPKVEICRIGHPPRGPRRYNRWDRLAQGIQLATLLLGVIYGLGGKP